MAFVNSIEFPSVPMGSEIPRKIHQIYLRGELPRPFATAVNRLKEQNPDWEHHLYSQVEVIEYISANYGQDILDIYLRINPKYGAARADLFRYLLLYREGGVYLDVKSGLARRLEDIIRPDDRFLISGWDRTVPGRGHFGLHEEVVALDLPLGEIQQWHIFAVAGHPFLRAVINYVLSQILDYVPWRHGTGGKGTYRITGPIAYSRAIAPLLNEYPHRSTIDTTEGLIYNAVEGQHQVLFKAHYYMRTDPVVTQRGAKRVLALAYSANQRLARLPGRFMRIYQKLTGRS